MKVLKQHLTREHHITPTEYRVQFGLPKNIPLVCNEYHEQRRASAIARGLGKKTRAVINPARQQSARGFDTKQNGRTGGFIIRKKQLNAAK
jgi:predicted transcriptional regulator